MTGYLTPAKSTVKLAIPSGMLKKGLRDVIEEDRQRLTIKIPLRPKISEERLIKYLLKAIPKSFLTNRALGLTST